MVTSNKQAQSCLQSQEKCFVSAVQKNRQCASVQQALSQHKCGRQLFMQTHRHRHKAVRSLKLSPLFLSKGNTRSATPSILCLSDEYFLPSEMSVLPAERYCVRGCLSFYILLAHTSSCMHLSLLPEAHTDMKVKKKCCIRTKGFSC